MPPSVGLHRQLMKWLGILALVLGIVGVAGFAYARFVLWPQVESRLNSDAAWMREFAPALSPLGLRLEVVGVRAEWESWLSPQISIRQASLMDASGDEVLSALGTRARFGPRSLLSVWLGLPVFSRLDMDEVHVRVVRSREGLTRVAGFPLKPDAPADPRLFEGLSHQGPFSLSQLRVSWVDESERGQRHEGVLSLSQMSLRLRGDHLSAQAKDLDLSALSPALARATSGLDIPTLSGRIRSMQLDWDGDVREMTEMSASSRLRRSTLDAEFEDLGLERPARSGPSGSSAFAVQGLSGRLRVAADKGRLQIEEGPARLSAPSFLVAGPVAFDRVKVVLDWSVKDWTESASGLPRALDVHLQSIELDNHDLSLRARGSQGFQDGQAGTAQIRGTLERLLPERAFAYVPSTVGPDARAWIRRAFSAARPASGEFSLDGRLQDFPFRDPKSGQFQASLRLPETTLLFAPEWPVFERAAIDLRFEGPRLFVSSRQASLAGSRLARVEGEIADLEADQPMLSLTGRFDSPLAVLIQTVNQSPVKGMLSNLTEGARASGHGQLDLGLLVDLSDPDRSRVNGQLEVKAASVRLDGGIPELSGLGGQLAFNEEGLRSLALSGQALGGPIRLEHVPHAGKTRLRASGEVQGPGLEAWLRSDVGVPVRGALVGSSPYLFELEADRTGIRAEAKSSLKGLAIRLPFPARKLAQDDWALSLSLRQSAMGAASRRQQWALQTKDNRLTALIEQQLSASGRQMRGSLGVGVLAREPRSEGLAVQVVASSLSLERWLDAIDRQLSQGSVVRGNDTRSGPGLSLVEVSTPVMRVGSQKLTALNARATPQAGSWSIELNSSEAAGQMTWRANPQAARGPSESKGTLVARLSRLWLTRPSEEARAEAPTESEGEGDNAVTALSEARRWPSIDLIAEDFRRGPSQFGQLTIDAAPSSSESGWLVRQLMVVSPSARLEASGRWAAKRGGGTAADSPSETSLKVNLKVLSGGGLLEQLSHPGLIKDAPGAVRGELAWDGSPADFRVASLRGQLSLDLEGGRFLKADPGLAKLIGVVNLQSLPSRISLDFRDIFSDGFVFQRVRGDVRFERGRASTQNLRIVGVQASVFIEGDAYLSKETQDIRVLVLPELNAGLASLGYALINPAIGLGSFLAQYVLRDPLRQILAYEYRVTGPWDAPSVTEVARREVKP